MTQERLTKSNVDKLPLRERDYFAWCGKLSGFGVRVWPNGRKTFVVQYRAGGRKAPTRRKSLGTYGTVTVEQARKAAELYLASARLGNDRVGKERDELAQMTVSQLCDDYIVHGMGMKKPSTIKTDIGRINAHIRPLLGKKSLSSVSRQDVERFLNDVANGKTANLNNAERGKSRVTGGKGTATRTTRLLGGIFSYAVNQGYMKSNPRRGVQLFKDNAKERFLSQSELKRLLQTIEEAETNGLPWSLRENAAKKHRPQEDQMREKISPHVAAAIRLLLLTGCRLREILHLKWNEVDLERGLLLLPDSKTGRKTVYLSDAAIEVLNNIESLSAYVIAGRNPEKPRADLKRPWKRITDHAGLENLRIHDLRHTFASIAAEQNLSIYMIGKLLGHKSPETTARYAHLARDPMQRGINQISQAMTQSGK